MEGKNKFIIENVTLDNELVLEKLNLTSNFNLFYARNGVSKTTIFNFLKNNYLNKFDNEYKIIGYSYLEQLKNLDLLYENLKKINLLNDTKDVIDSDKKIKKIIDDLKNDLNFLLKYKNFLIGYSENKFYFETEYNERKSSLEEFINDLDTFLNKILKNKNLLNDFLLTFSSYNFNLNSLNKNTLKEVAVEFNDFEKKLNINNKKRLKHFDKEFNINNKLKHFEQKIYNLFFKKKSKFDLSLTLRPIEIDFNKRIFYNLLNWLKNNCNEFCNKYNNFYILNFLLKNVYFFEILFNFFNENNYFWESVIDLKFDKINKKIKALSSKYNNVIKKKSRLIWMENMFNNFFFKYIKFSVIKEMDLIFLEQELNINIYLYNRLLNFNSELIYKISDGELNAILLISFFIECINSDKPLIMLLDDASVAFDRNNWIGLLSLLLKIFNENKNKKNKLIMLSHDSSFIRISSKFFSNNFTICKNNKISYKTIINEQGVIKISNKNINNNALFKNNFLLIHFFNQLINDSKQKEKSKDNIESMLHYSTDYSINDFVEKLSLSEEHKNELFDKIKNEYKLDLENDFIFDLFKSIYNDKNNKLYLIDFFYLRFLIEKFVSFFNKNKEVYKIGTIRFIEESKLDNQIKDRLKIIYSFLPIFIHCDFFDAAYLLNFNNNEAIANLINEVEGMLKEKNIS